MSTNEKAVHMIYLGEEIVGFFTRDEKSNENIIFTAEKATLEDISKFIISPKENKV